MKFSEQKAYWKLARVALNDCGYAQCKFKLRHSKGFFIFEAFEFLEASELISSFFADDPIVIVKISGQ